MWWLWEGFGLVSIGVWRFFATIYLPPDAHPSDRQIRAQALVLWANRMNELLPNTSLYWRHLSYYEKSFFLWRGKLPLV